MSGGEQQMLAIARALMSDPQLLLIDELSLGLSPLVVDEILARLVELNRAGLSILLIEQFVHRALDVADRVYVLKKGRVAFSGTPASRGGPGSAAVEEAYLVSNAEAPTQAAGSAGLVPADCAAAWLVRAGCTARLGARRLVPTGRPGPLAGHLLATAVRPRPYGLVSRVPVETAGGFLVSKSSVQLGKSISQAAGFTLGDLGDTFVVTSAPPGTITAMPSVINAQDPPSNTAPKESHLTVVSTAVATAVRSATPTCRPGPATSPHGLGRRRRATRCPAPRSAPGLHLAQRERRGPDGTVTTKAITSVQNVVIGPGHPALTIAAGEQHRLGDDPARRQARCPRCGAHLRRPVGRRPGDHRQPRDQHRQPRSGAGRRPVRVQRRVDKLAAQGLTFTPFPASMHRRPRWAHGLRRGVVVPLPLPRRFAAAQRHRHRRGMAPRRACTASATARTRTALPPPVSDATNGAARRRRPAAATAAGGGTGRSAAPRRPARSPRHCRRAAPAPVGATPRPSA